MSPHFEISTMKERRRHFSVSAHALIEDEIDRITNEIDGPRNFAARGAHGGFK